MRPVLRISTYDHRTIRPECKTMAHRMIQLKLHHFRVLHLMDPLVYSKCMLWDLVYAMLQLRLRVLLRMY